MQDPAPFYCRIPALLSTGAVSIQQAPSSSAAFQVAPAVELLASLNRRAGGGATPV